jgi:hypothetical protein
VPSRLFTIGISRPGGILFADFSTRIPLRQKVTLPKYRQIETKTRHSPNNSKKLEPKVLDVLDAYSYSCPTSDETTRIQNQNSIKQPLLVRFTYSTCQVLSNHSDTRASWSSHKQQASSSRRASQCQARLITLFHR